MTKWFSKLLRPLRRVEVVVVRRDPARLRLAEWRSSPDLVRLARERLGEPVLRQMLDVLRNEALVHATIFEPIPLEQRAVWQARAEGYNVALNNLESLAQAQKPQDAVEATYDPAEEEQQEPPTTK